MDSSKGNMNSLLLLLLTNNIPPTDGLCGNRVIKSSYKEFFPCLKYNHSFKINAEKA